MQKEFVEQMKTKLEAEKKELTTRLAKIATKDPKVKGDFDAKWPEYEGDLDRDGLNAHEVTDYSNAIGEENVLETRLVKVKAALERIDKGTYGNCSNCKAAQAHARLEADPAAEQCPDCGVKQ